MCLSPCTVAIEFSILRATSVSSCAGDAPGSDAVTITVGRSMSGKFWIFIVLKLITPVSVSMMKSSTAGIGLRMHQAETFTFMVASLAGGDGRAGARRLDRRRVDVLHEVAVAEEAAAGGDDAGVAAEPGGDLDPVADPSAHRHLGFGDLRIGADAQHVAEAVAQQHRA